MSCGRCCLLLLLMPLLPPSLEMIQDMNSITANNIILIDLCLNKADCTTPA